MNNTKQYQKNPKLIDAVEYCMKFRLREKETLEKLSSLGYNINVRTLRRIKRELPKPTRLDIIVEKGASKLVIDTLKDLKKAIKETKKIARNAKNPYLKLQAWSMISKFRKDMAEFYDAAPFVAELGKTKQK